MPTGPLVVRLLPQVARYATRLLNRRSQRSGALSLGRFYGPYSSRALERSVLRRYTQRRWNWNRTTIPLYGSPKVLGPAVGVIVPGTTRFAWENPLELPQYTPQFTFGPPRGYSRYDRRRIPHPAYELAIRTAPPRTGGRTPGPPPEEHRRRHDTKFNFGYNRLLRLVNRTYGSADEYLELLHAFQSNIASGPFAVATALAVNEAVDRKYGWRAQFLKKNVYQSGYWNLPVGYDALSRLWR